MPERGEILERVRAGAPLDHIPVIDFHTHLGGSTEYYHVPRSDPARVVACMDRFGIDSMVAFGFQISSDPRPGNALCAQAAAEHPSRIRHLAMLHAGFPQDWPGILTEAERTGASGIKLISQYQGVREEDVDWTPALEFASARRWIALHHSWGGANRLERWAGEFPEVAFVVAHASTTYASVVACRENAWQCTCAAFAFGADASVEAMARTMPAEKILHGSDALDLDFGTSIGPIAWADLPEDVKERILGRNAETLIEWQRGAGG